MAKLTVYHYYPLLVMGLYMFPPNCTVPLGGSGTSLSHHYHCIQLTTIKAAVHNVSGNGQAHCYHYYVSLRGYVVAILEDQAFCLQLAIDFPYSLLWSSTCSPKMAAFSWVDLSLS